MSVPVALETLHDSIAEYGRRAFLVTTDGEHPHVVSVVVDEDGDRLVVEAGRRSSANVRAHPTVTLLWPAAPDGDYGLIVDGAGRPADAEQGPLAIEPTSAVLHRMADAEGDGPSCIRILPAADRS